MTKMKTIFAIIFLALLIPVLLKAPESEAKVYRGKYANNTKWSYDTKTKTVIIECRGELPDDHHGSAGWGDYYLKAKKQNTKKYCGVQMDWIFMRKSWERTGKIRRKNNG